MRLRHTAEVAIVCRYIVNALLASKLAKAFRDVPEKFNSMKKIKSHYYGLIWILIWTAALAWFLTSGMFDERESIGLVAMYVVLVAVTVYMIVQHWRRGPQRPKILSNPEPAVPSLNAPCPCGSGKKYKRCCGESRG